MRFNIDYFVLVVLPLRTLVGSASVMLEEQQIRDEWNDPSTALEG